jgi:hypothetical protein
MRTKSDASVIQQVEADIGSPPLQLPLPLLCSEGLRCMPLCQVAPAGNEALRHIPHKLRMLDLHMSGYTQQALSPLRLRLPLQSVAPVHAYLPGGASWAGNRKPQPSHVAQKTGHCQQALGRLDALFGIGECADARAKLTISNRVKCSS